MKKNKSTRDIWIPLSWRYHGAGYQKNKKQYTRKYKHKNQQLKKDAGFYLPLFIKCVTINIRGAAYVKI